MSDAWFAHKVAPDGDTTDGCHPDEAAALKSFLRGHSTPNQAAEAITKPITHSSDPNSDLPRFFDLLADAFTDLPASNVSALVTLISSIENLPSPSFPNVPDSKRPAHGKLWRSLPGFGHFWSDAYPSLRQWLESGGLEQPAADRDAFLARSTRKAEVEARLVYEDLASIPLDWGYESVADALEQSQAKLVAVVPPACRWLKIAERKFKEGAEKEERSWALEKERDLWDSKGTSTMSIKRWEFWIGRLRELQSDETLPDAVRDAVKDTLGSVNGNRTG